LFVQYGNYAKHVAEGKYIDRNIQLKVHKLHLETAKCCIIAVVWRLQSVRSPIAARVSVQPTWRYAWPCWRLHGTRDWGRA